MKQARTLFDGLRSRARLGIAIEGAAWIALAVACYVFVSYGADRLLRLEVGFRAFLLLACIVSIGLIVARRMLRPMRIELTDEELALAVERQDPGIRQSLISAMQFESDLSSGRELPESPEMMAHVVTDVEQRLNSLPFHRAVNKSRINKFTGMAAGFALLVGAWAATSDDFRLWAVRNLALGSEPWPRDTHLAFDEVDATQPMRIAERDDVTLRVRASGVVPDKVVLECEFASGESTERPMEQIGDDLFTITLSSVLENLTVQAFGGDGETGTLEVHLVPRPRLTDMVLTVRYPEYLAREAEQVKDLSGDIRVPHGSTVELDCKSSKPLTSAQLVFADDQKLPAEVAADGLGITAKIQPTESGTLTLDALDTDRLGPTQAPQVFLRLVDDAAPGVEFKTQGIGSLITSEARIPGKLEIKDDYGLTAVTASFQVTEAVAATEATSETEAPPFEAAPVTGLDAFEPGGEEFETATTFDLRELAPPGADPIPENQRIKPGQLLALKFTAKDNFRPEPHEASSETMHFRVVTREKLLEELRRRQGEQRRELERVLKREQALRDEVAEIVSPTGDDPRAEQAKLGILAFARRQQALGRRSQGIGERYRRILQEFLNNRLFEPNVVSGKEAKIVSPLITMAATDFPESSAATAAFAETGSDDARRELVASYDRIIATIKRVLAEMEHTEDIAAVLEMLRIVIKTEEQARDVVDKHRAEAAEELFGPEGNRDKKR